MAKLKIVWSHRAVIQLEQILTFYNVRNENSKYSKSLYRAIKESLKLVARFPYMYAAVSYHDTRCFSCEYFKVFYSVHPDFVAVEAVFDMRQNPLKSPF